ncbi:MAG: hypothetical protein KME45_05510 [Stenomitos rutilans HA7619-LM2]|jgi:hypothetical protein|nr:hypothetical protein [Stenomitos rutilans HA7619-LM2]
MGFHPTALLPGLLLVLLISDLRDAKAIANQALRSLDQSAPTTQLADATVQTFHRGSGRRQLFREFTLLGA